MIRLASMGLRAFLLFSAGILTGMAAEPDGGEPNDSPATASLGPSGPTTFHSADDEDWFYFYVPESLKKPAFRFAAQSGVDLSAGGAGIVLDVHGLDGSFISRAGLVTDNQQVELFVKDGAGQDLADGLYLARLQQCRNTNEPACQGLPFPDDGMAFDISRAAKRFSATDVGLLSGEVIESCRKQPLPLAIIDTSGNVGTFSGGTGQFAISDNAGAYSAVVTRQGFVGEGFDFTLIRMETTLVSLVLDADFHVFCDAFE